MQLYETFNKNVSKTLEKITGFPAFTKETGYGDWSNQIIYSGVNTGINIIQPHFFADAGMVCVCRLTKELEERIEHYNGIAIFEASENIHVEFTIENHNWTRWTEICIKDLNTGGYLVSLSLDDMEEKDEDEYEENDENLE